RFRHAGSGGIRRSARDRRTSGAVSPPSGQRRPQGPGPERTDTRRSVPPRAQAAHQEASHLAKQLRRRLQGAPMEPYVYRDFGSLVSFGRMGAIGNLMNLAFRGSLFIEGVLARWMYRSLYKMHERALHGVAKTALGTLARGLSRHAEPKVKLH